MPQITITDTDLDSATRVMIAGKKATIVQQTQGSLTVEVPDDPGPGPWTIVVTTPGRDDDLLIYDPEKGKSETPTDEGSDPVAKISKAISDAATKIADAIRGQQPQPPSDALAGEQPRASEQEGAGRQAKKKENTM
jgi:hypothetical protein